MSQLHATLYGATFVAKMTKAIADGNRKTSAGAETPNVQNTEKQENVSNTTSLTESQNTEKQENVSNTTSLTGSQNTEKQEDNTTPLTESQNTEKQENVSNTTESQKSKEPSKFALRIRNAIQNKSKSGSSESSADSETSTEKKIRRTNFIMIIIVYHESKITSIPEVSFFSIAFGKFKFSKYLNLFNKKFTII